MTKSTIRKIIIYVSIFLTALILAQSIFYAKSYFEKKSNHEKVVQLLSDDHGLSGATLEEAEKINSMITNDKFSDSDLGLLYEHAGLIYMQLGEEMTYYRYLGYALYYLEYSEEKDYTVNIYMDLANFHINNKAYNSAEEMIDRALEIEPIEEIENIQIKSYSYRTLARLEADKGDYNLAEEYVTKSSECVDAMSDPQENIDTVNMFNEILLAKIYLNQGFLDECEAILNQYDVDAIFTTESDNTIIIRNFVLPYYETKCTLQIARNLDSPTEESKKLMDEFISLCKDNGYEKTALDTLLSIQSKYPTNNDEIRKKINGDINSLSRILIEDQSQTYSTIINSQVNDSRLSMAKGAEITNNTKKRTMLVAMSIIITSLIILFFIIIILNSRRDGLTFLFNRRSFNYDIERVKHSNLPYSLIMIDIDDFKKINDTYGHQAGDQVLQKLGQFINSMMNADIKGYRYGGEEFAIIVTKNSYLRTTEIAESLRRSMEASTWTFAPDQVITISLGAASGSGSDDVTKKADDNLYASKQHGKNQLFTD